jgi:hypothetical protein
MMHSPVHNYAIPGLTSWLIGQPSAAGTMRAFTCEREHQEPITPHSHRFDFQCWVLAGSVKNRTWRRSYDHDRDADEFHETILRFGGEFGRFAREPAGVGKWRYSDAVHAAGSCYSMPADDVHSIYFSRGAMVLFFEGPSTSDTSLIIEPVCQGRHVPTFKVEPWMFERRQDGGA